MADLAASIGSCCARCSTCSAERSSRKSRRGPATPHMRMTLFGDMALLVEDEPAIDAAVNARILAISELVRGACVPGVRDVVPSVRIVCRAFRSGVHGRRRPARARHPPHRRYSRRRCGGTSGRPRGPGLLRRSFRPGSRRRRGLGRLGAPDVVAAHIARGTYRVFMVGFLPGFPYLASVDERIAMPRRDTPRLRMSRRVGRHCRRQTGVYPFEARADGRLSVARRSSCSTRTGSPRRSSRRDSACDSGRSRRLTSTGAQGGGSTVQPGRVIDPGC